MRLTYKMEAICEDELLQCWVVRFSPPDENPWYDVSFSCQVIANMLCLLHSAHVLRIK